MSLRATIEKARAEGRTAFIAYLTAGDPDLKATADYVVALAQSGVDIIELGVPFSDPVADGPTNQAAAARALAKGTTLEGVFTLVAELRRREVTLPLVLFTYLNPVYRLGFEAFAKRAAETGVTGALIVDLPPEEASGYGKIMHDAGLETVFLASPTTASDRLRLIDAASTGFLYYVSRTGVTGTKPSLSSTLLDELGRVRAAVKNPVAVGFGLSTPEHAKLLAPHADAVVVGSAFVKIIEGGAANATATAAKLAALAADMIKELQKPC